MKTYLTSPMNTRLLLSTMAAIAAVFVAPSSVRAADEKIWHVKAIHPEGRLLDVKAIDKDGKIHGIKAIESDGNVHLLDIKALVGDSRLPVKVLPKAAGDTFEPVKAIGENGTVYAIKALTADGAKLDVKGVKRSGNVIHIKAVAPDGTFYGIKAISGEGRVYDLKGIKMSKDAVEGKVNGVDFAAHIKALPQAPSN
jgi:ribosomal protein L10